MISRSCMSERYPGQYDPASMAFALQRDTDDSGHDPAPDERPSGLADPGPCPLCGRPLYAWIALPAAGDEASVGVPLGGRERILVRCESCGVALERDRKVDLTAEWAAVCRPAEPPERLIVIPNRASVQAGIGVGGWAAIDLSPGRLIHTPASLELLAEHNGHAIERRRGAPTRRAQVWMWQTLLNGLTFRPNFARELRAGRVHPRGRGERLKYSVDLVVTVLGAPLVALVSLPLELVASLAGRGGELIASARERR
jgi:hypothetical protein